MCTWCISDKREHRVVPLKSLQQFKLQERGKNKPYFFLVQNECCSPNGKYEMEAFFQTFEDDVVYALKPDEIDLLNLLVMCGVFSSKSQALKAGWKRDIPKGFSEWKIGKLKTDITIFNPFIHWNTE